ncbi:MAG: alpha-ketoacid dehydrogenase subunit beta [Alphaproteobacteria bacterium]|nr:alpha-ketoacid dehydrogenase subunit beta [Alphaproteobacteria bacterium]
MSRMSFVEATRQALAAEMRRDGRIVVLGEDLGRGGVFQQYRGLQAEFGPARVVDTPISESAIMGVAVGAAMCGARPVVEMRYLDFTLCAVDELVNQAAKLRYMLGGQARVPMVVRQPIGLWANCAAQHSQSLEAWWVHVPGLVVLCPGDPADAGPMLAAAIRADDPVVLLEYKELFPAEGEVGDPTLPAEIGRARLVRPGHDLTLVAWGGSVREAAGAAELLAARGISAEVIDLRSLWPWDSAMVLASVARTGHLLVAQEATEVAGFGAEIAALVAEETGARVARIGAPRTPIPFSPALEAAYRVDAARIAARAAAFLARHR